MRTIVARARIAPPWHRDSALCRRPSRHCPSRGFSCRFDDRHWLRQGRGRGRSGLTLLEVILAMGLAVTIMLAVYQSTSLLYLHQDAGRDIAEHAQLVRALSRQLGADVRGSFTRWKPTNQNQQDDDDSGEDTSIDPAVASAYQTPPGGVLGYPNAVTLVARVAPTDFDFSSTPASSMNPITEVRLIRYTLATPQSPSTVPGMAGMYGLIREELYRLPAQGMTDTSAWARCDLLAPEVQSLAVQYFDGSAWVTTWDNTRPGAPAAIEMTVGFVSPRHQRMGTTPSNVSTTSLNGAPLTYYRVVASLRDRPPEATDPASTSATSTTTASSNPSSSSSSQGSNQGSGQSASAASAARQATGASGNLPSGAASAASAAAKAAAAAAKGAGS